MAITTQDQLVSAVAAGQLVQFNKASMVTVAGFWYSHFRNPGRPGAGATPSTAAGNTLDRTSVGALAVPAPSATSYISSAGCAASQAQTVSIADRLVETAQLSGITTTAQTVNSVALPARAAGVTDIELWLEIYTLAGNTASATVTCSYTNQSGTSGRTATLIGGIPATGTPINRSYQFSLQAGDTGVQSVQTFTSTTSTGTAGNLGIVLRRTGCFGFITMPGGAFNMGWAETDLSMCGDSPCLEVLSLATTTLTGQLNGYVGIIQG